MFVWTLTGWAKVIHINRTPPWIDIHTGPEVFTLILPDELIEIRTQCEGGGLE